MRKLLVLIPALALSGCFNILCHVNGDEPYKPYESTKGVGTAIAEAFVVKPEWHYGSSGEASLSHAYAVLFLPCSLVAFPLELVADTVTFPYDVIPKGEKK